MNIFVNLDKKVKTMSAKHILLQVKISTLNSPNENNRVYPKAVFKEALDDYLTLHPKGIYGMLGMPKIKRSDGNIFLEQILAEQISHFVTNFTFTENEVFADIHILNTPAGDVLEEMLINKVELFFRTAGYTYCNKSEVFPGSVEISKLTLHSINVITSGA